MKRIYILVIVLFGTLQLSYGQETASSVSETISVDFRIKDESQQAAIEIISPEYLSQTGRGMMKPLEIHALTIKGHISSPNTIQSLSINEMPVKVEKSGLFTVNHNLIDGENLITFEALDDKGITTTKEFTILKKANDVFSISRYYALIIGIDEYDDPAITDLNEPTSDAEALYKVLTEEYTFDPQFTKVLKNPSRDKIYDMLDNLSLVVTENDNLLIFYAGHGYWDESAEIGYWLPSDALQAKKRDWMRNSAITEYVREINSHHTLLITDACFGGSIFKTRKAFKDASMGIEKLHETPSRKAMTSGTLSEVPDKSVFMKYLLKQLESNKEKYTASEQLFYNIKPAVLNNSENTPQYGVMQSTGDEGGDFIFIKRD